MRRTKIVATIGPASANEATLREMIESGLNVARINFSHVEDLGPVTDLIALIRQLSREAGRPIGILQDLAGPKLRVGLIEGGTAELRPGSPFTLTTREVPGTAEVVSVSYPELPDDVKPGDRIYIDDGTLLVRVEEVYGTDVRCRVIVGGTLRPHKGMNLPGVKISTPAVTDKDKRDLAYGVIQGIDFVAMSFVRTAQDVRDLRKLLSAAHADTPIIAKIEKPEAVACFNDVLAEAEGIMIARGDLGVEMAPHEVPIIQKQLISATRAAGKPVITATQMLESMTGNPRPTRAEASDVANAIFDGTDAVMLSGETATGRYPVQAVEMMCRIAEATEPNIIYHDYTKGPDVDVIGTITEAISTGSCAIAQELNATAIATATESGYTARMVAKHRPRTPILAVTANRATYRRLSLVWGVRAFEVPSYESSDAMFAMMTALARRAGIAEPGRPIVITAGLPLREPGRTNLIKVLVPEFE